MATPDIERRIPHVRRSLKIDLDQVGRGPAEATA
jgi:hypothetical protein